MAQFVQRLALPTSWHLDLFFNPAGIIAFPQRAAPEFWLVATGGSPFCPLA
jgi:hypothetical protein